ncbi:MAG: DUF6962 family protein [Thermodesulfobacteriota bacterium]
MRLHPVPTELTTAGTDALLALLCLYCAIRLRRCRSLAPWKTGLWISVLLLLAFASALGTVAHGLDLPSHIRDLLWYPLYLCLGMTVALFAVGAILDWQGTLIARRVLPWAISAALAFSAITPLLGGSFLFFLVYEALAMIGALCIYAGLARRGLPGSGLIAAAITLTLLAAAVQASDLSLTLLLPFDHNGLFHLVQMPAIVLLCLGLQKNLHRKS